MSATCKTCILTRMITLEGLKSSKPRADIEKSVNEIVGANNIFFVSTVRGSTPYGCVMVFSYDEHLCMFFMSKPSTEHVKNILKNPKVAGEIADTHQTWESPRRGIQFMGTAREIKKDEAPHVVRAYMQQHPGFERHKLDPITKTTKAVHTHAYVIRPTYLKIFDEKIFGRETWVEVELPNVCQLHD